MESMVNKKGLSDVISTVLIILLVLAAVGIIGSIVLKQIKGAGSKIETSLGCGDVELTPVKCSVAAGKIPTVLLSRGNDNVTMTGINLIFEDSASVTEIKLVPANELPEALATSSHTTTALVRDPAKVTVAATIRSSDGKDNKCPASTTKVTCIAST